MYLFGRLGTFIENRRLLVIIVSVVLIVASVFGALQLTMASGIETFLSPSTEAYKDFARFNQHFGSNSIVVLVTGGDLQQLLEIDALQPMEAVEKKMAENPNVLSAIGPAFLIKQAVAQQTGEPVLPTDSQELWATVVDPQTGQVRPQFRSIFPDNEHALIAIVLKGELSQSEQKAVVEDVENTVATADFASVAPIVTGVPVLMSHMEDMMGTSMRNMFIVAIFLMLLILAVIFSVRGFFAWRWLPLGVVVIGIIYTFGAMGVLSVPITMVTMAVFPILIGLGVDYAIQFHNRYDEEASRGETVADAIIDSVTHIGPAIGMAIVAACLGFAALFFSPVPMIQDFGRMLIIGVVACYIVAMFLLLAILYWRDRRATAGDLVNEKNDRPRREHVSFVERGLQRLAPWVIKNPAIIIPVALVLTIGGLISDSHIGTETDQTKFISQDVPAVKNLLALEEVAGGISPANVLIEARDVTDPAVLGWMVQLEQHVSTERSPDVIGASSIADLVLQANDGVMPQSSEQVRQILEQLPLPTKRNFISDDYTAANLVVNIRWLDTDQMRELKEQLTMDIAGHPAGVNVTLTGMSVIEMELFSALTSGREKMTLIGVGLIFFGLFVLFRFRILRAFAATLPIALILGWSSGVMFLLGIKYTPLTATLGALILGIGVEFTILLMMRYYEERGKGNGPVEAMTTAMTKIGRAIVASGLTVIGGFAALLIARDFLILRDFGIVTMINVFFALVATLVVLPTLIVLFDNWQERRRARRLA